MSHLRKYPPLWSLPIMLTKVPLMLWAGRRGNYKRAMKIGRSVMASPYVKSKAFEGYTPTKHDVFVCVYSKSGTNWMMQIVTQIASHGKAEFERIHDIVPWPETPVPGAAKLTAPTWEPFPAKMRPIKTHVEAAYVPYSDNAKYVIVIRDPKDAIVSGFYFSESLMPGLSSMGLSAWVDSAVAGETPFGSWADHIASFWPWRHRDNVLVLTYAEMKADLETAVRRVAQLMNVTLTADAFANVVEKSSFPYMKAHNANFTPPTPMPVNSIEMVRTGKTGEAKERLTIEQITHIDQAAKADLKRLGSDFPYDDYFG